jgi:tetratricopeptide (TPR) repeat protein
MALEGISQADEAIKEYSTTMDLAHRIGQADSMAIVYLGRGRCYIQKNELASAMRDFTAYIQIEPNQDAGYYWQAIALQKLGDLDQALNNINRAITLNPGDADNYIERAKTYELQGDKQRALEDFSRAITLDPKNATAHGRRGQMYAATNDHQRAIADFSRALELNPNDLKSLERRAAAYTAVGDTGARAADMAKVAREAPIQRAYSEYFKVSDTAYNNDIRAIFTEADMMSKPNWGAVILRLFLLMVGSLALGVCAMASSRGMSGIYGLAILALLVLLPIAVIGGAISAAKNKSKAATAYIQYKREQEARMPGFEQFFTEYIKARSESRLQDLPGRTRAFFETGPGNRFVQSYAASPA